MQVLSLKETPLTAMVGGYFLCLVTVKVRDARPISTIEYAKSASYVTIAHLLCRKWSTLPFLLADHTIPVLSIFSPLETPPRGLDGGYGVIYKESGSA